MKVITSLDAIRGGIAELIKNPNFGSSYPEARVVALRNLEKIDVERASYDELYEAYQKPFDEAAEREGSRLKELRCNECCQYGPIVVEVGEEPDYESSTARLCLTCLEGALKLIKAGYFP